MVGTFLAPPSTALQRMATKSRSQPVAVANLLP